MAREVYLQPGELYFGSGDIRLTTLLGSCVSVTLWHPVKCVGGMCHYMLPTRPKEAQGAWDGRYADEALAMFRRELHALHLQPREFQVGVFGGGNMFPNAPQNHLDVGARNAKAARILLPQHGFNVDWEDLCGDGHRRIWMDLRSGDIRCVQTTGDVQRVVVNDME